MRGSLSLRFDDVDGRGRLVDRAWTPPLQVVREFANVDGSCLVHLQNTSGGVLAGDDLTTDIHVGPSAKVQLTTTSATRVYRSRGEVSTSPSPFQGEGRGEVSRQSITVYVDTGGLLEYLPDPLIPFAGSRLVQSTSIVLAADAGLFWWETVSPGRVAHGEIFAYERLDISTQIAVLPGAMPVPGGMPIALDGHDVPVPLLTERIRLDPKRRPIESPARMGPYRFYTTFYACRVGQAASGWDIIERELMDLAETMTVEGQTLWGASKLPAHGVVVRGLSRTGHELPAGLIKFWRTAKRSLYDREAIVPRKIY